MAALAIWSLRPAVEPPGQAEFVRAEGRLLLRNGAPFRFRSVGFANDYGFELGDDGFSLAGARHHAEPDFDRVRGLGFNSIRFAFNGNWYRDDPRAFWRWLDRNVGWAEKYGLLLTLDLHVPIGGSWLDPSEGPGDFRIWTDAGIRAQNVDLWREIAQRYRDVPAVAAYDILNEPVTADATGAQWRRLAGDMVRAIREVDPNHLLIVGPVYGTGRHYGPLDAAAQFLVDDGNVMYDFHFYEPVEFTHQSADWLERPITDGGVYPDPDRIIPTGRQVLLDDNAIESRRLRPGRSGWEKYESDWGAPGDARAVAGLPVAIMRDGARGTVFFDDLEVFEYDPAARTVTRVRHAPLSAEGIADWWEWGSADPGTFAQLFTRSRTTGSNDGFSLGIDAGVGAGDYLGWSSDSHWFGVKPGRLYKVSGYMKGEGVTYAGTADDPAFIGLALDFYAHPDDRAAPGVLPRGRDYLEYRFLELYDFGRRHDVPMSVMEFGTIRKTFEVEGTGGAQWIADMLDIFEEYDASFSLWNYHGPSMGLFQSGYGSLPAEPNQPLIDTVTRQLRRDGG